MKLTHTLMALTAAATLAALSATPAFAAPTIYDSFTATSGTALGGTTADVSGFTWFNGGGDNYITGTGLNFPTAAQAGNSSYNAPPVVAGLSVTLSSNQTNADKIALTSADNGPYNGDNDVNFGSGKGISTSQYYSLLLNVSSAGIADLYANGTDPAGGGGNYNTSLVAAFGDGSGITGGNPGTQITGIYLQQGTVAGTFQVGIGGNRNGAVWDPTNITAGTPVFIVAQWVNNGGGSYTSNLWEDPTLGLSSPVAAAESTVSGQAGGFNDSQINSFSLSSEAGLPTLADGGVQVDEVRIDGSWANVTPAGVATPEPGSLALLGLAATGLLARRNRRTV